MSKTLYTHPDGYEIEVETLDNGGYFIVVTGPDDTMVAVPIGPRLLQKLAADLADLAEHPG